MSTYSKAIGFSVDQQSVAGPDIAGFGGQVLNTVLLTMGPTQYGEFRPQAVRPNTGHFAGSVSYVLNFKIAAFNPQTATWGITEQFSEEASLASASGIGVMRGIFLDRTKVYKTGRGIYAPSDSLDVNGDNQFGAVSLRLYPNERVLYDVTQDVFSGVNGQANIIYSLLKFFST